MMHIQYVCDECGFGDEADSSMPMDTLPHNWSEWNGEHFCPAHKVVLDDGRPYLRRLKHGGAISSTDVVLR